MFSDKHMFILWGENNNKEDAKHSPERIKSDRESYIISFTLSYQWEVREEKSNPSNKLKMNKLHVIYATDILKQNLTHDVWLSPPTWTSPGVRGQVRGGRAHW